MMRRTIRGRGGFTLIEMLIVILVISVLMALITAGLMHVLGKARYTKTAAMIKLLDGACQTYRVNFSQFPPNDKGDSRCLHHYLGQEQLVSVQRSASGSDIKTRKPPVIEFQPDMLDDSAGPNPDAKNNPVPVVDAWSNPIKYANPGKWNRKSVDLWSSGQDGVDQMDPSTAGFDDVVNWEKEY